MNIFRARVIRANSAIGKFTSTMVSFALLAMTTLKFWAAYLQNILVTDLTIAISRVAYLNTQFPTSSTFHALIKATSPPKAVSKTYRFPLISRASLGIPGISMPFSAPPSLYRWGIVPVSTAVEAPVGVKKAGMPAACARIRSARVPWGTSSRVIFPLRNLVSKFLLLHWKEAWFSTWCLDVKE